MTREGAPPLGARDTADRPDLARLVTEQRLAGTDDLDQLSTQDLVRLMNEQDALVPAAVALVGPQIAAAVDHIAARLARGGRLIYIGAGTAGRIGVLDASECRPTFGTVDEVQALIAGGPVAVTTAVEGSEDDGAAAAVDLQGLGLTQFDAVVGISASGRTPYAVAGVRYARSVGAFTVGVACNPESELGSVADLAIEVVVGPEFLTGSTRLKAGTAQKLVCNTISTLTMMRIGRTYGNLMVHMTASNGKLWARAHRLVRLITGREDDAVEMALQKASGSVPVAVLTLAGNLSGDEARDRLAAVAGNLRAALAGLS